MLALLDGFPLQHHAELEGRIIIDDPDSWEEDCEVKNRIHGTAMASIILRGDLNKPDPPPIRPIYIRPILKPEEWPNGQVRDNIPHDVLTIDLVHRAFRRMFELEGNEKPAAPTVRIVVLAVCDSTLVEQRFPSPFARLIDYLSYKYNVLVLIACGNQASNLSVKSTDIDSGDPDIIAKGFANAVNNNAPFRHILSPGESINGLTIGATHADNSIPDLFSGIIDPYLGHSMPSPINSQGPGFRRVIKPEVLVPGGRQLYRKPLAFIAGNTLYPMEIVQSQLAPGIKVSSPSPTPSIVTGTRHIRGTSASTAYVGHLASICCETLLELQHSEGSMNLNDQYIPVLIKAMLTHGAKWGTLASEIEGLLGTQSKAALMRLLGYGEIETDSLCECNAQRAIMLGWGDLLPDQAHLYRIPLPLSLNGVAGWRRVTITLAAIGSMNSANHKYRKTQIWFDVLDPDGYCIALAVNRKEADWQAVRRGMLQHEVLDGNHASVFGEQGVAQIQVNCRTDAGGRQDLVRYGLVVSLEVAPETNLPIYQEIRNRIVQPITITPNVS
ncbi:MAG: S8 family peptidase [Dehalococcoidales bacterium]|nr:S8 family peptidase [Dehalococcoidales bacterium]